jgi:hypothetical protein
MVGWTGFLLAKVFFKLLILLGNCIQILIKLWCGQYNIRSSIGGNITGSLLKNRRSLLFDLGVLLLRLWCWRSPKT